MSNLEQRSDVVVSDGSPADTEPTFQTLPPRLVELTPRQRAADPMTVRRYLPTRGRRMVGAWCFVDYYGPDDITGTKGMQVPPHPHCGLQTVSWLLAGEVLHRDSIGNSQLIRPTELNLMTAGAGIAHAETSSAGAGELLHGLQLWAALPAAESNRAPSFEHHADLPRWRSGAVDATVLLGTLADVSSPASAFSPLVGAELAIAPGQPTEVPLRPDWEYAALTLAGDASIDWQSLASPDMAYLGCGRDHLMVQASTPARLLLIGGQPFSEEIVMWWNFIGRSHEDIVTAREGWNSGSRFGAVTSYDGPALTAPAIPPLRLKPRGRH